jgi:hypothetical protein
MIMKLRHWLVLFILAFVCALSYGLFIHKIGFYLDDWPDLLAIHQYGTAGIDRYFLFDNRPGSGWTFYFLYPLFGINPLYWNGFNLLLRFFMAAAMGWAFSGLWKHHPRQVALAAILFAVYPVFSQQASAVTYHQKYIQTVIFFLSIGLMIQAVRRPRRGWAFTIVSIAITCASLTISEFFVGLELLRPVILWMLTGGKKQTRRAHLVETLKQYLPYLLVFVAYVTWRIFFMEKPVQDSDRNFPILLLGLLQHPRFYSLRLLSIVSKDFVEIVFLTWRETFNPALLDPKNVIAAQSLWVAGMTLVGFLVSFLALKEDSAADEGIPWFPSGMILGALAVLTGCAPGWAINRSLSDGGLYGDRFGMAAMFGASLLLVGLFDWLFKHKEVVAICVSILVALAAGWQYRNAATYATSWERQLSFYWQLSWRAPGLAAQTTLLSAGEGFSFMGDWPTSSAINILYPKYDLPHENVSYWYSILHQDFVQKVQTSLEAFPIYFRHNSIEFNGGSDKLLATDYEPQTGACLWILGPQDQDNPILPEITRQMLPFSNLSLINAENPAPGYPPLEMIGPEPRNQWCYYFQKADLSRQVRRWEEVGKLWKQAVENGFAPKNGVEVVPFMEGFAHLNQWEKALQLSRQAAAITEKIQPYVCSTWKRIEQDTQASPMRQAALEQVNREFGCHQGG